MLHYNFFKKMIYSLLNGITKIKIINFFSDHDTKQKKKENKYQLDDSHFHRNNKNFTVMIKIVLKVGPVREDCDV